MVTICIKSSCKNVLDVELFLGVTLTGDLALNVHVEVPTVYRLGLQVQSVHVSPLTDSIPPIFSSQM